MEKLNNQFIMNLDFSIIIPTFNNLEFLKRAIRSIENQTTKNFETIIVVDGSTDGTIDYLEKYDKKKINLKFFFINASGGPAKPRNIGMKMSSGKWLCFLDSDDEWSHNKIEELNKVIKKNNFDILYHLEILKNGVYERIINKKKYKKNLYINLLLNGNICSTSATIVNSEFVKNNNIKFLENIKFISVEDYGFWLDIAKNNGRFLYLNKVLGTYYINDQSLTSKIFWHKKNMLRLVFYHIFVLNIDDKNIKKIWPKILLLYKVDIFILKIIKQKKYNTILRLLYFFLKKPNALMFYILRKINL